MPPSGINVANPPRGSRRGVAKTARGRLGLRIGQSTANRFLETCSVLTSACLAVLVQELRPPVPRVPVGSAPKPFYRHEMRSVGWIAALVLAGAWFLSDLPSPGIMADPPPPAWRRTGEGWVHFTRVLPPSHTRQPGLHPALVAILEILISSASLLAFSGRGGIETKEVRTIRLADGGWRPEPLSAGKGASFAANRPKKAPDAVSA
jgi:hypothetical protein